MALIPEFSKIDHTNWERKDYFDYYYYKIKTKYTLNANIEITDLLNIKNEKRLKFFPVFLFAILKAVNQNKEFRMSFDKDGNLGYWNFVLPSYTIFHNDDKTFSDIWSDYSGEFTEFYNTVTGDIIKYKNVKGIIARPDRPANYCHVSALPWLSFSGYSHDTFSESSLLFPLIRFGKYFYENNKVLIPFAVFVNHAVADGYHTSKLINDIQDIVTSAEKWLK
ncbi:MAG: chloramphenicol acetyltransferase CAT [Bacteroidales bacterium]|jgi:chloramphenicol O-acetyltransferase type A|nr:chloramphenicol acetyltransferase CAT [Bacteroidales bacterium]